MLRMRKGGEVGMPDLDKVIREIKLCTSGGYPCENCSHYGHGEDLVGCMDELLSDALALLKEQEPVSPVLVGRMWECGKCHAPVGIFMDDQRDQFCRTCGRSVKWE